METTVQELAEIIMPLCGLDVRSAWTDACNLNYYKSGSDCCGWHAVDEPLMFAGDRYSPIRSPPHIHVATLSKNIDASASFIMVHPLCRRLAWTQSPMHIDIVTPILCSDGKIQQLRRHRMASSSICVIVIWATAHPVWTLRGLRLLTALMLCSPGQEQFQFRRLTMHRAQHQGTSSTSTLSPETGTTAWRTMPASAVRLTSA